MLHDAPSARPPNLDVNLGPIELIPVNASFPPRGAWQLNARVTNVGGTVTYSEESPADDERCVGWARDVFRATAPLASGGVYVNFLTADEGDRVAAAYGVNYRRLAEVKRTYDPDNLFRVNQNIKPV
jgi:FAD/FMN-containing dehydrogenase